MITDKRGGKWFKGNLHTHTTNSDGKLSPADAVAMYKSAGYDFLALTDHWVLSEWGRSDNMLLISGCEYNSPTGDTRQGVVHIVGVGMNKDPMIERGADMQSAINAINGSGGIAIYAHPSWSLNSPNQIKPFYGLKGVEIYNSTCGLPENTRPYSGVIVDLLARDGYILPIMAADDTHSYNGDTTKSFIMVNADELTPGCIMSAIREGRCTRRRDPELYSQLSRVARVESSRSSIIFFSDTCGGVCRDRRRPDRSGIQTARKRPFVRAEAVDAEGRYAWSQIIQIAN